MRLIKSALVAVAIVASVFSGIGSASATPATISFTSGTVSGPHGHSVFDAIAYGNGHWVGYSSNGFAYVSTDGKNFTEAGDTGYGYFADMTYGDGKFVLIGNNWSSVSSDNGQTWHTHGSFSGNDFWHVAFGDGKFVAAENDSYTGVAVSTDGYNWTEHTTGTLNQGWNDVAYGDGKFLVFNYHSIDASSDGGVTWTNVYHNDSLGSAIYSGAYGNGHWLVVSAGSSKLLTSTNGTTWTVNDSVPVFKDYDWEEINYGSGTWFVTNLNLTGPSGVNSAMSQDNGATWTLVPSSTGHLYHSAFGNNMLLSVGDNTNVTPTATRTTSPIIWYTFPPATPNKPTLANTGLAGETLIWLGALGFALMAVGYGFLKARKF